MDFAQVVKKRFMCRSYQDRDVPDAVLERILDLAVRFPSAGHTQPQEFIVVRNGNTKYWLAWAALDQFFIAEALVVIAVVSDTRRSKARYSERGEKFYSIVDGAFAALLVLLATVNEGLGAAFVGAFDDDEVNCWACHKPCGRLALSRSASARSLHESCRGFPRSKSSTTSGGETGTWGGGHELEAGNL